MVLLMTINCTCGNAIAAFASSGDSDHACCREGSDADADHDHNLPSDQHRHEHDRTCQHCQPTSIAEPSVTKYHLGVINHAWIAIFNIAATNSLHGSLLDVDPWHQSTGLPPPVGPPTLLSLGCALNT
jgi:hypothetical protein